MAVKKLFLALPIYGGIDPFFFQSLIRFVQENKIPAMLTDMVGDSAISRARNNLTHQFLASDCSDLLFIDTDLIFSAAQVERICSHDLGVVGGLYPKKQQGNLEWVINTLDDPVPPQPNSLQEVKYIGTGFLRINRAVFETMIRAFGNEIVYTCDSDHKTQSYDFWRMGCYEYPNGYRRWLSEDWWFCQMWRDLGGKVWADQQIILKHSGRAIYPLQTQEAQFLPQPHPGNNSAGSDTARSPAPLVAPAELQCLQRGMQPV